MTLKELATEYRESAQLLRNRLKELRAAKKTAMDMEERFWINRRIADLTPMLTQINKVADLLENYYERGYWREASISSNSLADGHKKVRQQKILLRNVIENELTEDQRGTFLAYHVKGLNIPAIAEARGVNKSTVCRTLKRAERNIQKYLQYL